MWKCCRKLGSRRNRRRPICIKSVRMTHPGILNGEKDRVAYYSVRTPKRLSSSLHGRSQPMENPLINDLTYHFLNQIPYKDMRHSSLCWNIQRSRSITSSVDIREETSLVSLTKKSFYHCWQRRIYFNCIMRISRLLSQFKESWIKLLDKMNISKRPYDKCACGLAKSKLEYKFKDMN